MIEQHGAAVSKDGENSLLSRNNLPQLYFQCVELCDILFGLPL